MGLYGIYGSHSPESCPLNDLEIRRLVLKMAGQLDKVLTKNNVKLLQQYHSSIRTHISMDRRRARRSFGTELYGRIWMDKVQCLKDSSVDILPNRD